MFSTPCWSVPSLGISFSQSLHYDFTKKFMMKNSKLKLSEYMQNISRSKSFEKFVFIALVASIHSWQVWAEIEWTVYVALLKQLINQFKNQFSIKVHFYQKVHTNIFVITSNRRTFFITETENLNFGDF